MKLKPGLATSWEFLDNNSRIRFKLRENVKFHNGEPFNAAAVKFTFDRLLGDEGKKGPQQSNYNAIDHVEVVDDNTVDFVMKQPDPVLLTKLAGYGAHDRAAEIHPGKGRRLFQHPSGRHRPVQVRRLRRRRSASRSKPFRSIGAARRRSTSVVFRLIAEANTQVAELQAGRIDIAHPHPVRPRADRREERQSQPRQHHRPDGRGAAPQHQGTASPRT